MGRERDSNSEVLKDDLFIDVKNDYNCSFKYIDESKEKIAESLNKDEIQSPLKESNDCLDEISVSVAVVTLRNILIKVSEESLGKLKFWKNVVNPAKRKKNYTLDEYRV